MKFLHLLSLLSLCFCFISCANSVVGRSNTSGSSNDELILQVGEDIEMNLGTTHSVSITVESNSYDGEVNFSLDRSVLDNNHTANTDIIITLSSSSATFTAGQQQEVILAIEVKGSAPSFKSTENSGDGSLSLLATLAETSEEIELEIPFQINAVYESRLSVTGAAAGTHSWSQPTSEEFRTHADGLTIRFINTDADFAHRVHSSNGSVFAHQPAGGMAAAATDGNDGGRYEVTAAQDQGNVTYYCHDHQGSDTNHTLSFGND